MRGGQGGRGCKHVLHITRTCTGSLEEMTEANLWTLGANRILHCVIQSPCRISVCHGEPLALSYGASMHQSIRLQGCSTSALEAMHGRRCEHRGACVDACCSFQTCCAAASLACSSSSSGRGVLAACCSSSSRGRALPALLSCATPHSLIVYRAAYDHLQNGNQQDYSQQIDMLCHLPRHAGSLPEPVIQQPCHGCCNGVLCIIKGERHSC